MVSKKVKIKYNTAKAVVGKFPNRTGAMIKLLRPAVPALDWVAYFVMPPVDQLV